MRLTPQKIAQLERLARSMAPRPLTEEQLARRAKRDARKRRECEETLDRIAKIARRARP